MIGTVTDENMPLNKKQKLMRKKIRRDIRKWIRDPDSFTMKRLKKLRSLSLKLEISIEEWPIQFDDIHDLVDVSRVMRS